MLTEEVATLRARIVELENPGLTTPSVTLYDPYGGYKEQSRSPTIPQEPPHIGPHSPFSPTSTISSLPSGSSGSPSRPLLSISSTSSTEEPPQALIPFLIETFLPHATEFGFFLDILSFHRSAILRQPFGHPERPTPALLTTVYLWGAHLSRPQPPPQVDEHALLIRALHHVVTDTLGEHPKRILHTIQAEVLLAAYYFRTTRFLEAKARLGSAVSLVLTTQMHRLRSSHYPLFSPLGISNNMVPVFQHNPQTSIDEGEHINGFWAVFSLHKMISFALDPAGGICGALEAPGLQIDTPWPFDSHDYRNGCLTAEIQGNQTVMQFLSGAVHSTPSRNETSLTSLLAKASILCHRATYLMGQWTPSMGQRETQAFWSSFRSIDNLVENLRAQLPELPHSGSNTANTRTLLLIHSLTNSATIKLHSSFSYADPSSSQKCIKAASDMVSHTGVDLRPLGTVNSVYGALWHLACTTLIDEISRRQTTSAWPNSVSEEVLKHHLELGRLALSTFSEHSAYIRFQRLKVEQAYENVNASTADYLSSGSSLTPSHSS